MDVHFARFWEAMKNANLTPVQTQAISAAFQWAGMIDKKTLRDELAGLALAGYIARGTSYGEDAVAKRCYDLADAMLEARKK